MLLFIRFVSHTIDRHLVLILLVSYILSLEVCSSCSIKQSVFIILLSKMAAKKEYKNRLLGRKLKKMAANENQWINIFLIIKVRTEMLMFTQANEAVSAVNPWSSIYVCYGRLEVRSH